MIAVTDERENLIKQALEGCFDRVLGLFDGINMSEHRNELLCFFGIESYRLSEPKPSGDGAQRSAEIKYAVRALSKRNMSAEEFCRFFDETVIPAIENCGAGIKEIKREPCEFSKEHGCHALSAILTAVTEAATEDVPEKIPFLLGSQSFDFISSFEIKREIKTVEIPTLGSGIRTRMIGSRPVKIILRGESSNGGLSAAYTSLAAYYGALIPTMTVNGMTFGGMALSLLSLSGSAGGASKLTAEFTEVNEA